MTRSAVRSRLAPPAFAGFASFGSASHTDLSGRSPRRLPRRSPLGRRRATHKCIFYISARQATPISRAEASEGCRVVALLGEDGLSGISTQLSHLPNHSLPRKPRRPLFHEARHAFAKIAAAQRHHHLPVGVDGRLGQGLERHIV